MAKKLKRTLKFKGSGEGEGADGFKGVELETNRLLTVEDCTEEFIRGCSTEDCTVGNGSWGNSDIEQKNRGHVYFMESDGGGGDFRILAEYKSLAAALLKQVKKGVFSETTKRNGKTITKIFTYDLGDGYDACEEEDYEEDSRELDEAVNANVKAEKLKEILRLHALWVNNESAGKRANLGEADLTGAILTGAILNGAYLREAELEEANLSGANLMDANLMDANLRRADLNGANLTGADLTNAYLNGANLTDANLTDANLTGADLIGADLTGANLRKAILRRADLTEAKGAKLEGAKL